MQEPNPMQNQPYQPPYMPPAKRGRGFRALIIVLVLLLAAGIVMQSPLFRVERVLVAGNVNLSEGYIVERSGLNPGQNMFSVNKEEVEKSVNADRFLVFEGLEKDYATRTVTLYIYERVPVATLQTLGIQYELDCMGYVLDQSESLSLVDGLLVLTGLKAEACILGRPVQAESRAQLNAYQSVMYELNALNCVSLISELNVLDMGNLYLVSADGMAVRLGEPTQVHAKMIAFLTVKEQLDLMGKTGGTVDVSIPVYPVYIP